jgi:HEAT repeat protein
MGSGAEHWARVAWVEGLSVEAVAELIAVVEDESGRECRHTLGAAIASLGRIGARQAGPAILKLLARTPRDGELREAAVAALGAIGEPRARRLLERIAREEPDLAEAARAALAKIGGGAASGTAG